MKTRVWWISRGMVAAVLMGCGGAQSAGAEHACRCAEGAEAGHGHGHGHGHGGGMQTGHGSAGGMHHAHGEPGHHHGEGMTHDFSDVARFEAMFDAPGRAAWQRPVEVVALLGAARGQAVVDLGAGTGYFLPYLATAVGPSGHVVALDSEPAMVTHLQQRAEREGLQVVEARAVQAGDPGLEAGSADGILIVDTWHHLPERAQYAARLRDALRPGGTVLVVDFTLDAQQGPPVEMRIAPEVVVQELEAGGLAAEIVSESLPDQYVVRGTRAR